MVLSNLDVDDSIEQDFYVKDSGVSSQFLEKLKKEYPFTPQSYIDFLEYTNGADIAQCRFLEENNFDVYTSQYSLSYPKQNWLVFGFDAGGRPLLINLCGNVCLGEKYSTNEEFIHLANSFSEFLTEVIMGQNYALLFDIEPCDKRDFYIEEIGEDPWLAFLVKQNWINLRGCS